ncbi:hypothetical protein BDK51DRAFT_33889, partial [Blyttiomyces helicus]
DVVEVFCSWNDGWSFGRIKRTGLGSSLLLFFLYDVLNGPSSCGLFTAGERNCSVGGGSFRDCDDNRPSSASEKIYENKGPGYVRERGVSKKRRNKWPVWLISMGWHGGATWNRRGKEERAEGKWEEKRANKSLNADPGAAVDHVFLAVHSRKQKEEELHPWAIENNHIHQLSSVDNRELGSPVGQKAN